jgi:ParB-like chromosome segregation protein Spo0J
MHEARPLIVDENNVVLGGNMRLKAFTELGYKEVWVDDMKDWSEEQKQEFVIADNVNFGEWDYDLLANQYDVVDLDTMGVELDPNMFGVDDDDSVKDAEYF